MEKRTANTILVFSCIGFFSFGVMWAAIGPLLSQFAERNHTTLATIGGLYTAIFLGAVTAQLVLGRRSDQWGQLRTFTVALLVLAAGITGVSISRWLPLTFALAFLAGWGHGMTNLSGNVMIGRLFKENSVSALNLVNVFFGVGAFIGPLLVSVSITLWTNGFPALYFSLLLMFLAGMAILIRFFNVKIVTSEAIQSPEQQQKTRFTAFLWSMGVMILIYVGAESSMGGWATTYMQQTTSLKIELASLVTSGFWLAITLGRLSGTFLGSRLSARRVLLLCLATSTLGAVLFMAGFGQIAVSIAGIFFIGLGFGAIYPTSMAMVTTAFPSNPGQAGSVITSLSAVGGMVLPWLQGVVMEKAGIRSGTYSIAAMVGGLILLFFINWHFEKKDN
jgi:fucose permease